jgi:hypothetical protein
MKAPQFLIVRGFAHLDPQAWRLTPDATRRNSPLDEDGFRQFTLHFRSPDNLTGDVSDSCRRPEKKPQMNRDRDLLTGPSEAFCTPLFLEKKLFNK